MARSTPLLRRGLAALCCLLALLAAQPVAAETLTLNTSHSAPRSRPDDSGYEDRIVAEAFRRAGLGVRVAHLPSERCLRNVDAGVDDGNYSRVAGLQTEYPNLVPVPEPVDVYRFTVFTKNPALEVRGWAGLSGHSVGVITGWKIVERHTDQLRDRTPVRDMDALFTLLATGRVELVVADRLSGLEMADRMGLSGVRALSPPLARRNMYLYLHKRHAALAPKVAEALRRMKRDGTYQRLLREGLGEAAP